jgi:predicted phosphate transport protein (TIGR00153 family)
MVFPAETEEKVKRRALSVCQDHVRKVVETVIKLTQLIEAFSKRDKKVVKEAFEELKILEDQVEEATRLVSTELVEIGRFLSSREDFLRFVDETEELSDFCEGIAFRLLEIMEKKWKVPSKIRKNLLSFSEKVLDTVVKLREMTMTLNYSSINAIEKAREVKIAEEIVDNAYRELDLEILLGDLELPVTLLLRDITHLLEDISDKAEDASDAVRILALTL